MSHITDIILTHSNLEPVAPVIVAGVYEAPSVAVEHVNAWCREVNEGVPRETGWFVRVDEHSGGGWGPQAPTYRGHFNYLDDMAFCDALLAAPWAYPDEVQLFVKGEHERTFRVVTLADIREKSWGAINPEAFEAQREFHASRARRN